jgi:hypothetical protein
MGKRTAITNRYINTVLLIGRKGINMVAEEEGGNNLEDEFVKYIKPYKSEAIGNITSVLNKYNIRSLRRSISYYPIRFLIDGVAAYRYGFNEASIFHAGASIELGLLGLMQDKVNQTIHDNPKSRIDLYWLIENAGNLLDDNSRKICHDIRLLRNCYVHYENIVAHLEYLEQVEGPEIKKQVREKYGCDPKIMEQINELERALEKKRLNGGMLGIRLEYLEKEPILSFISWRYMEYIKWLSSVVSLKGQTITKKELEVIYIHEAFDAQECLTWAFNVNIKLGFIKI